MPDHYACPFTRESGDGWLNTGQQMVVGSTTYDLWEWFGRHESYQTWLWNNVYRAEPLFNGGPKPKYSNFNFNMVGVEIETVGSLNDMLSKNAKNRHRNWSSAEAQKKGAASLSDVTVIFCAQGNFVAAPATPGNPATINNFGSHRTSAGGGTNAIFADSHAEWIPYMQIGFP